MEIQITGMKVVPNQTPNKRLDVIVANFDANVGPLRLSNCALTKIHNRTGEVYKGFSVKAPFIKTPYGHIGITIMDRAFHTELMNAARDLYLAMGGNDDPGVFPE